MAARVQVVVWQMHKDACMGWASPVRVGFRLRSEPRELTNSAGYLHLVGGVASLLCLASRAGLDLCLTQSKKHGVFSGTIFHVEQGNCGQYVDACGAGEWAKRLRRGGR